MISKLDSDDESSDAEGADADDSSITDQDIIQASPREASFDLTEHFEATTDTVVDTEEDDHQGNPLPAQLLHAHHRQAHMSMHKLQQMAKRGLLPKSLATCKVPICSACMYGKATRKAWRGKKTKSDKSHAPTTAGAVIGVDQLVSPTAGVIAQMAGRPTLQRYKYATVFVDHATGYGYTYMQRTQSAEETVLAKVAFEKHAAMHGVKILNYHADNGIFSSKLWQAACNSKGQGLTFAAVGAHHMNGRCERRVRELQELARTNLIHTHNR